MRATVRTLGVLTTAAALLAPAVPAVAATPAATARPAAVQQTASVQLSSVSNFRDLGGYATADGRHVRSGLVYRSGKLSNLTTADQQKLLDLHVNLDVDLRNAKERSDDPDNLPAGIDYRVADVEDLTHGISFSDPAMFTLLFGLLTGLINGTSNMGQSIAYPFMVTYSGAHRAYHDLLTDIANDTTGAVDFHCTAGKDRTGWGAAVLLTLLGVPRTTVNADYLASNTASDPDAVQPSWLNSAFEEVDHVYGSFTNYLHDGLNLSDATIAKLRSRLLTS